MEKSIDALARLHVEHEEAATKRIRTINGITHWLGRPAALIATLVLVIAVGAVAFVQGRGEPSTPLFGWLELSATIAALLVALLILVTQRHDDALSKRRAQLTLQLALIADQRTAKLITLMEEFRRDIPDLANRRDRESEEMSTPSDAARVLDELDRRTPEKS